MAGGAGAVSCRRKRLPPFPNRRLPPLMKKFALPMVLSFLFVLFGLSNFLHALATHQPWRIAAATAGFAIALGLELALGLAMRKHAAAGKAA